MNLIDLESAVTSPGDCWGALRQSAAQIRPGEALTVRAGHGPAHRLGRGAVRTMLTLAGFVPGVVRPLDAGGFEMEAIRVPRTVRPLTCSVIVPCRNEEDNVAPLVERLPALGTHTQLIFVDDSSTDDTAARVRACIARYPDRDITLISHRGQGGKAGAVFHGFDEATGDILMILDADMTVAPEDLPRFYLALAEGVADFANGTRFTYPMEEGAMRSVNVAGNRVFGWVLTWLLGSRITDSLCGTKAIFREDWARIRQVRSLFGGHDPWGDFDLLLSAAYLGLRIIDIPVAYHARVAGESKMKAFRHGWVLGRAYLTGIRRLKLARRPEASG